MLHAGWNALVKSGEDKFLTMTAVVVGSLPISIALLPFVPMPAYESWPYLAAGIALHASYSLSLMFSYRLGDLTHVYPLARGSAPLLVGAVSVLFLNVPLAPTEIAAIVIIAAGIMSLCLVRQSDGNRNAQATFMALLTGCFIAAYSLVDGTGARLAGTSLGFYCWLTIGHVVLFSAVIAVTRPGLLSRVPKRAGWLAIIGGNATFCAFALIIWAFTQAPIALVSALRETSIIFALLIGVFFLGERFDFRKVAATMISLLGIALLQLSKR